MKRLINRELSWLAFNERVLEEAEDKDKPLLEGLRFISIVSSNLDEFYMIRVGSLWDQLEANFHSKDPSGMRPLEQIEAINQRVHSMVQRQYKAYFFLMDRLREKGIYSLRYKELSPDQVDFARDYYRQMVYPVLTPLVVDASRPFPLLQNKSLNVGLLLQPPDEPGRQVFATVQVPSVLPRLVKLPSPAGKEAYILLEKIIKEHLEELFSGHKILTYGHFRITRNADLGYDEEEAEDLLATIEEALKQRKWGKVVRLEVQADMDPALLSVLQERLEVKDRETFFIVHSIDPTFLPAFVDQLRLAGGHYPPFKPHRAIHYKGAKDFFKKLRHQDVLLHHPYDDFRPVLDMVRFAATDDKVLAIKMTLYRVSGNSPIIAALAQAAERGKQVTVLVELKARFDEESNIHWAKKLEKAGAHVIYGMVGLKTHSKLLMVIRREKDRIRPYLHLSTGNYNDETARLYDDLGLMTTHEKLAQDVTDIFNSLSSYSRIHDLRAMAVAPQGLRTFFVDQIDQEIDRARRGEKGLIEAKMNSLIDKDMIEKLYEASRAGVTIRLLVRGICGLIPGKKGLSENIEVRSIVGRFLEHSRIYKFGWDNPRYYLSSADWMRRNLDRRIETLFPILDDPVILRLEEILRLHFADNVKSRILGEDGSYRPSIQGQAAVDSQARFLEIKI